MLRSIKQLMQHNGIASADNYSPWIKKDTRYFFLVTIRTTCEKLAINFTHYNKNSRNVTQVPRGRFNNRELNIPRTRYVFRDCPKPDFLLSVCKYGWSQCIIMHKVRKCYRICYINRHFVRKIVLERRTRPHDISRVCSLQSGRRVADCQCKDKRHWTIGQEISNCFTKSWDFFASLQFETVAPAGKNVYITLSN